MSTIKVPNNPTEVNINLSPASIASLATAIAQAFLVEKRNSEAQADYYEREHDRRCALYPSPLFATAAVAGTGRTL